MDIIIHAFTIGILLSLIPGPVFFVIIENSITKGIRSALAIDFGIMLSDILYILLSVLFVEQINSLLSGENKQWFDFLGGLIFIIFGIFNFFKKSKIHNGDQELVDVSEKYHLKESSDPKKNFGLMIAKGFLLNFANPLVIFYWLSVASVAKRQSLVDSNGYLFLFLGIILATYFTIDLIKIFTAKRIRNLVDFKLLNLLNKLIGTVFIGFGLYFVLRNFFQ
jgi:threonine/homoserine/homoserine lactone efflux protein